MAEAILFLFICGLVVYIAAKLKRKPAPKVAHQFGEDDEIDLVGESHYQDALLSLFGPKQRDGIQEDCPALLILEPTNAHDKNAVYCEIRGKKVGYLPRAAAKSISARMKRAKQSKLSCTATVKGGWKNPKNEGSYGVTVTF